MSRFQEVINQAKAERQNIEGVYEQNKAKRFSELKSLADQADIVLDGRRRGYIGYKPAQKRKVENPDDYMSAYDLADLCSVTARRIVELCVKRQIPAEKISGRWHVPKFTAKKVVEAYQKKRLSGSSRLFI